MSKRIAYLMSRFPKVTETFILYEILELQKLGAAIEIFPLIHQQEAIRHDEAIPLVEKAHYTSWFGPKVVLAQFKWLFKNPPGYLGTWGKVLWHNRQSPKFLSRALITMPLASHFALEMQKLEVEHVHAHWATHPALAAYVIHQLTGLPYSFTAHAHDIYVDQTMLGQKIADAEFVVTISDYNRQFLTQKFDSADKIRVIHCGIDPGVFQPRTVPQHEHLTLICVASLEAKKGHRYLIEACHLLKETGVDFRCWLVGDGDLRTELEALSAQWGLTEHLIFWGRQPRETVVQLLQDADALILPSIVMASGKKEGISVALMEALASELPVVATDISGTGELIINGETGYLVPEKDARAIFDAVMKIHQSPETALQLGKAGRQKVLREFNLATCTQQLYEAFQKA